jgi:hypothetical protein
LYDRIVRQVERELIQQVLQSCDRVQIKAASRLGINRNTLHKKLSEYRLDDSEPRGPGKMPDPVVIDRCNGDVDDLELNEVDEKTTEPHSRADTQK